MAKRVIDREGVQNAATTANEEGRRRMEEFYQEPNEEIAPRPFGHTVSITSPPDTAHVNANALNFPVVGNDANKNVVDGTLTDKNTGKVYLPTSGGACTGTGSPYGWTLYFNNSGIAGGDTLYMYAYDTVTADCYTATYTQRFAKTESYEAKRLSSPAFPPIIEVLEHLAAKGIPEEDIPEEMQDISVKVTHALGTEGFILLILRRNGDSPAQIVKNHRLELHSFQTTCTFRGIQMSDWDLVCVNVIADGVPPGAPVVLKPCGDEESEDEETVDGE